jgi:hypothetical protein
MFAAIAAGAAQRAPADDLAQRIDARFEVLAIRDGVVLTPREPIEGVRSIELSNGAISIDGDTVTGAELRSRLGATADLVLQLSYLPIAQQRAIASSSSAAPAPQPPPRQPDTSSRRGNGRFGGRRSSGTGVVHIGRGVRVDAGEVVQGDAVSIGGSVSVQGEVQGDVVAIGGSVDLGPQAVVNGDVVVVGGELHRDPAARVQGEVQIVGLGDWNLGNWLGRARAGSGAFPIPFSAPFALITQVTRVAVLCLLAVLVVLVAGNIVERVGQRAADEPLKAGAVGFLAQVLFLPLLIITIVLLVVTIIGIPLLVLIPFAILGLVLVGLVGFTAVAYRVGQIAAARFAWTMGPYMRTVVGVLILLIPLVIARLVGLVGFPLSVVSFMLLCIGWLVEYVAWTVGFGAVALTRFSKPAGLAPKAS